MNNLSPRPRGSPPNPMR